MFVEKWHEKQKSRKNDAITVRIATAEDLDVIEAIERECFPDPWSRQSLEESLSDKNTGCDVAV